MVQTRMKNEADALPSKIQFPTEPYTRDKFFKTEQNVRYNLKFSFINGQQASNLAVGIEDLVELAGDIKYVLEKHNISITTENHNSWTVKFGTADDVCLADIDAETIESEIESIAEDHGIALEKSVSLSGRGFKRKGSRLVLVSYQFGTYKEKKDDWIQNPHNPLSYCEMVGGTIGTKDMLEPNTVRITNVETDTSASITETIQTVISKIRR